MTSAKSEDGRILYPWVMRDVESFWNKWFSQKFNFRSYTHGKSNSAGKAAYRFSRILRDGAVWLDGSGKTDVDLLLASWEAKMLAVSVFIEQNGTDEAAGVMNKQVTPLLTFWQFHAGGCQHIHHLSCLQLGIDPDGALAADQERRKAKAESLKDFDKDNIPEKIIEKIKPWGSCDTKPREAGRSVIVLINPQPKDQRAPHPNPEERAVEVDYDEIRHVEGADIKKPSNGFRKQAIDSTKLPAKP